MSQQFDSVAEFIREVPGLDVSRLLKAGPMSIHDDVHNDRVTYMQEELNEFKEAESIEDQVDALVDLQYFLYGTLIEMGVDYDKFDACFNIVHNANMQKKGSRKEGREVSGKDAYKPEGWKEPDFTDILK